MNDSINSIITKDENNIIKKRICMYARVSSEEQSKNGFGIDVQKDSMLRYINFKQKD